MCTTCGCSSNSLLTSHFHQRNKKQEETRFLTLEKRILEKNDSYAKENRERLQKDNIPCINIMSSPGSGKTSLLVETITKLRDRYQFYVVEGDQQTDNDAEKIKRSGAQAIQVNTGKGCHLDAAMVSESLSQFDFSDNSYLFIENIGNLICPADFDLGETARVVMLSVTEGEDKPQKYANMFALSQLMLITKIDLLPHVDFDIDKAIDYAKAINPKLQILPVSIKTGEGMSDWYQWMENHSARV